MSKVIKAIHETVVNGKMPSKVIASAIGKPYSTLLRETNPLAPGAKLGVETFIAIIEATGDSTPAQRDGAGTRLQACPCGLTASHERGGEHPSPRTMRGTGPQMPTAKRKNSVNHTNEAVVSVVYRPEKRNRRHREHIAHMKKGRR